MRTVYVIIGFDADGNCEELGKCEPSNPVAEALISSYSGRLVNLHWVVREDDGEDRIFTAADLAVAAQVTPAQDPDHVPPAETPALPVATDTAAAPPADDPVVTIEDAAATVEIPVTEEPPTAA